MAPALAASCLTVIGRGRMGWAIARALRQADHSVDGPLGRDGKLARPDAILLCVPDDQIAGVAADIAPGPIVGHCSGATGLEVLAPHPAFSLHPLTSIAGPAGDLAAAENPFAGASCAVAAGNGAAEVLARRLAADLGMAAFVVADEDRAAYHAAASMASNFLVTVEAAAERLAAGVGGGREMLVPLVRATVENWATLGPLALTGPIARGDEATVGRQREAVAQRAPDLLELFDALTQATHSLAARALAASVA